MKVRISNQDKNIVYYIEAIEIIIEIINDVNIHTIEFSYNNKSELYCFSKDIVNNDDVLLSIEKGIIDNKLLTFTIINSRINYGGSY